ncbi:MAG: hypothetical protein WCT32_00190 [Patescibacteria group bacterium]|jgi:hypothetical protein
MTIREMIAQPKKPGWQLLLESARAMTALVERSAEEIEAKFDEAMSKLTVHCSARFNEVIPEERLEEVLAAVAEAACAIGEPWSMHLLMFHLAHEGIDGLKTRIGAIEGWGTVECGCHEEQCMGIMVAPNEHIARVRERARMMQMMEQVGEASPLAAALLSPGGLVDALQADGLDVRVISPGDIAGLFGGSDLKPAD